MSGLLAASRRRLTPVNIGAAVWYDASDLSTLAQNSDGTGAVAVGDPVGRIMDKSGNNRHAIQATAGMRPTLRQDSAGYYYLEFVAASTQTLVGAWSPTAYPVTMMFSGQMNTATTGGMFSLLQSSSQYKAIAEISGGVAARVQDRNATALGVDTLTTAGVNYVFTARVTAATMFMQANRNTPDSLTNTNAFGLPTEVRIGSLRSGGPYSSGRFYSGLMVAADLSGTNLAAMQSCLAGDAGVLL